MFCSASISKSIRINCTCISNLHQQAGHMTAPDQFAETSN